MRGQHEKRLAADIDQALRALPNLPAPRTLLPRIMSALEKAPVLPWHSQPWELWPAGLRLAALIILLGSFGGLCLAGWELGRAEGLALALREVRDWCSPISAVWNVLNALLGASLLVVKQLGVGFISAGLVALALSYGLCVGLGAAWVRFAFARR